MADIKQAAKWMIDGKHVRRRGWAVTYATPLGGGKVALMEDREVARDAYFWANDLLADDWEIAE